ncbi:hypothetical protein LINGRAHAP2_LOCUS7251 [Linum grandiflorum]
MEPEEEAEIRRSIKVRGRFSAGLDSLDFLTSIIHSHALPSFPSLPPFVGFSLKVFCLKLNYALKSI